jgi:hypothetical protein
VNFIDLTTDLKEPHLLDIEKNMRQIINEVEYFCNIAARHVTGHGLKKASPWGFFKINLFWTLTVTSRVIS